MLLSDGGVAKALESGELIIEPVHSGRVQPASVDLRLDRFFRTFSPPPFTAIDPAKDHAGDTRLVECEPGAYFTLTPGQFVLGSTLERITLAPSLAGYVEGKSSLGRLALMVHATAGLLDPGFSGHSTLQIYNALHRPIILRPGMKIAQLMVLRLDAPALLPYGSAGAGSRYQDQRGPTPSRSHVNFDVVPTTAQEVT